MGRASQVLERERGSGGVKPIGRGDAGTRRTTGGGEGARGRVGVKPEPEPATEPAPEPGLSCLSRQSFEEATTDSEDQETSRLNHHEALPIQGELAVMKGILIRRTL